MFRANPFLCRLNSIQRHRRLDPVPGFVHLNSTQVAAVIPNLNRKQTLRRDPNNNDVGYYFFFIYGLTSRPEGIRVFPSFNVSVVADLLHPTDREFFTFDVSVTNVRFSVVLIGYTNDGGNSRDTNDWGRGAQFR